MTGVQIKSNVCTGDSNKIWIETWIGNRFKLTRQTLQCIRFLMVHLLLFHKINVTTNAIP